MTKRISGKAQGVLDDAAERWLRENDPNYAQAKRGWTAPTTDALCRTRSEVNDMHPSLESLTETVPKGHGSYLRRGSARFRQANDVLEELHGEQAVDGELGRMGEESIE